VEVLVQQLQAQELQPLQVQGQLTLEQVEVLLQVRVTQVALV
jgi:hypothetical protein